MVWSVIATSALVSLVGGPGAAALVVWQANKRKVDAEANKTDAEKDGIIVDTARELVADLRAEVDRQSGKINKLLDENKALRRRISRLETQIKELGAQPQNGGHK